MKTNFTNNLFQKRFDMNSSNISGGYAACGTSCATQTDGGSDWNTQTYDDDGCQTSNKTTYRVE